MRNILVCTILSLCVSYNALAVDFNKKHYMVIKDIIWAADKVEVPRIMLLALCWGEGSFRTDEKIHHMDGGSLSYGTCQMKLATALWMDKIYRHKVKATEDRLKSTKINAFYAAKYLKYLLRENNDDWQLAVDAYNKGTAIGKNTKYVKKFNRSLSLVKEKIPEDVHCSSNKCEIQ